MSTRRTGRAPLAVLAAASLIGAAAAGVATGSSPGTPAATGADAATDAPADAQLVDARPAAVTVTDPPPRPAAVDSRLVTSVAREVLADQDRDPGLTDVDLIARDVLSAGPVDAADAHRLTLETLLGDGPGPPAATDAPAPPQCPPSARACVDVDGKRAWMVDAGRVTYGPVPVTTGKPGYETTRGTHHVLRHVRHDDSRLFDSPMPYSTYFTVGGMAFHQGRLDEPSHGCVHLGRHAAAHFFDHLRVGDEVVAF